MNLKENPDASLEMLSAMRKEADPLQLITEYLKVKEMGPSDHIRTKHEVKVFIESGDLKAAKALVQRASDRIIAHKISTYRMAERQKRAHHI